MVEKKCLFNPKLLWKFVIGFILFLVGMGFFIFSFSMNWLLVAGIGLLIILISYIPLKIESKIYHCEL